MRLRLRAAALFGVLPVVLLAQAGARPAFDVVSVKPNRTGQGPAVVVFQPGGRVMAGNVNVRQVILVAYGLEDVQLINAPDWTTSERFAIEARTGDATPTDAIRLMLRTLLSDRFNFVAHPERRELPIFALVAARADKRLGPRLRPAGPDCTPVRPPPGIPMPPPPPPGPPGGGRMRLILPTDEILRCGSLLAPGWLSARKMTMKQFAVPLTQLLRRPVIDETGLAGDFDLDLTYAPDTPQDPPGVPAPPSPASDRPSLFTAMQEDLGLKLDSRRGPVDVLVVDRVERPSEN